MCNRLIERTIAFARKPGSTIEKVLALLGVDTVVELGPVAREAFHNAVKIIEKRENPDIVMERAKARRAARKQALPHSSKPGHWHLQHLHPTKGWRTEVVTDDDLKREGVSTKKISARRLMAIPANNNLVLQAAA